MSVVGTKQGSLGGSAPKKTLVIKPLKCEPQINFDTIDLPKMRLICSLHGAWLLNVICSLPRSCPVLAIGL